MKRLLLLCVLSFLLIYVAGVTGCKNSSQKENAVSPQTSVSLKEGDYTFEDSVAGWNALGKEVSVSQSTEKFHDGKASLKISGTGKAGVYSFLRSDRIPLSPGKHYTFKGWMLIDSISSKNADFKLELHQEGKWLQNIETTQYDVGKKGTWQELSGKFAAPTGKDVAVSICVEKAYDEDVNAVIYVDALSLQKAD